MKIRFYPEYYWFTIFVLNTISYQLVQDNIRLNYDGENLTVKYLLGIAPNFFPAFGIPALFVILIPIFRKKNKPNAWLNNYKHITANILSLIGLLSWEFLQMAITKGRFDWNDVLWTFIGALIFQLIWTITPARLKEEYEEAK
ncbi:MAG: hypothetical protein SGI83_01225 [Bacteroidota bacterium]|nr:hypothetical protein [Bacteroidota bacterium]